MEHFTLMRGRMLAHGNSWWLHYPVVIENEASTAALENSVSLALMQCYATVGAFCFKTLCKKKNQTLNAFHHAFTRRIQISWKSLLTCFPMGSGFVMVVLKKPSHSSRPYSPAQWLCLFPVWGRHQGIRVLNCRSAGWHGLPSAHEHTPRKSSVDELPFFGSRWV